MAVREKDNWIIESKKEEIEEKRPCKKGLSFAGWTGRFFGVIGGVLLAAGGVPMLYNGLQEVMAKDQTSGFFIIGLVCGVVACVGFLIEGEEKN